MNAQHLQHWWHAPQICFHEHLASQSLAAEAHQLWHPEINTISTFLQLWWPLPNIFLTALFCCNFYCNKDGCIMYHTCSFSPRRCPCCKENYQTQEFHRCWYRLNLYLYDVNNVDEINKFFAVLTAPLHRSISFTGLGNATYLKKSSAKEHKSDKFCWDQVPPRGWCARVRANQSCGKWLWLVLGKT